MEENIFITPRQNIRLSDEHKYKKSKDDIQKHFSDYTSYNSEILIYNKLKKYNIVSNIISIYSYPPTIFYELNGFISIREYLNKLQDSYKFLLELFSFVRHLSDIHFVHRELSIDNMYYSQQKKQFILIDLHKSYFTNDINNINIYNIYMSLNKFKKLKEFNIKSFLY